MSEADNEVTKATDTSPSVKLVPNSKRNAENQLSLKKKKKLGNNSISSELESLSLLQSEQIAEDKSYKLMQLSIEEHKFSIEECKMGMLEQEIAIKIEKLKAETERERLHVDKERLNIDKEILHLEKEKLQFKVDVLHQRTQLLKEVVPKEDVDNMLPIVND